jgi:hypothetical protein
VVVTDFGGRLLREGMQLWRGVAPLAEPYAKGLGHLVDLFGFMPAATLQEVVSIARGQLVDRPAEIDVGTSSMKLVLRDIALASRPMGPALGQLGDVRIVATDVHWNGMHLDRIEARLRNVHFQPGSTAVLVAAPVEFEITVDAEEVDRLVAESAVGAKVVLELGDAVARLRPIRGARLGHADVVFEPGPRYVHVVIVELHAADRLRIRRGLSAIPTPRFELPSVLRTRVHAIDIAPDAVVLRGHVAEFREPVGFEELQQLADRLESFVGGVLEVPRTEDSAVTEPDRARAAEDRDAPAPADGA